MKKIIQLIFILKTFCVLSQDGSLDLEFIPNDILNSSVRAFMEQQDGKILIGSYNPAIIRLNSDGTNDISFNSMVNFSGEVNDIAIQKDNKIIVVGSYPSYIKRFNMDGTADNTFNFLGGTLNGRINNVEILNNGKIIIAGVFDEINNTPIEAIAKLNSDGSLDTSFNLNLSPITSIRTMDIQPDGKIIIAGQNDESVQYRIFSRYFEDGTFDTNFNEQETHYIYDIEVQEDGKIMICGTFSEYDNITQYNIARLNNNGTLDTSFTSYNLPQDGTNYTVFDVSIIEGEKYLINGSFSVYNDITSNYIAKINHDGTIDTSFDIGTGPNDFVWETYIQNDSKILIGGDFTSYNGISRNKIARLNNTTLSTNSHLFTNGISFYPNPVKKKINIKIGEINIVAFAEIYTLIGQLLKTVNLNKDKIIDLSELTNGIYFVKITNGSQIFTSKIIKI